MQRTREKNMFFGFSVFLLYGVSLFDFFVTYSFPKVLYMDGKKIITINI